jgi:Flp pilus assembly protein TadG
MKFRDERGNFLTEFALVLPALMLLLVGTIDVSTGMLTYFRASRIAYESVRYGTSLPGLPDSMDTSRGVCEQSQSLDSQTAQVVTRAQRLASGAQFFLTSQNEIRYFVSVDKAARQVNVCVEIPWRSVFYRANTSSQFGTTIRAKARAPYLFPT